jgi:3-hydroxymyristoyl/3-hydroxydecanoyl-(acyl carrier protein) dehydratase
LIAQLPHRFPFRFAQAGPGTVSVVLSGGGFWLRGDRFPESLVLEALAQGAALAVAGGEREGSGSQALAGVEDVHFHRPIEAGMCLRIEASRIAGLGPISKLEARAFLGTQEVARAVLLVSG